MRVVIVERAEQIAILAANLVQQEMQSHGDGIVLGLATGGTPLGLYRELIQRHRRGLLSFANVTTFNLDEYVDVPIESPHSYHTYMRDNLFRHIDIDPARAHIPKTDVMDLAASAEEYEQAIKRAGGVDLQILGIGSDGHIGFNEIGSSFGSRTRVKTLTEQTRKDNARFFDGLDAVPTMALTMGIATIMSSRSILLLASGAAKANAIRCTLEGPVTATVPASILQFHPSATIILDGDAASGLEHSDYYVASEKNRALLP